MGIDRVASEIGISRQALHAFLAGGDIKLSNLLALLDHLGFDLSLDDQATEQDVTHSLAEYGASLVSSPYAKRLPLGEAIVRTLTVCRDDVRVSYVLPQVLIKQAYRLNQNELLDQLRASNEGLQLLGYHLQMALEFRYRAPLDSLLKKVKLLCPRPKPLYLRRKDENSTKRLFPEVDNSAARSWNVLTRENLSDLINRLQKWERLNEAS